jgi:hypothetical protein
MIKVIYIPVIPHAHCNPLPLHEIDRICMYGVQSGFFPN